MHLDCWSIHGKGFHFGQRGLGLDESGITFPSDSLSAAVTSALAQAGAGAEPGAWNSAGRVRLTSTFPLAGTVRFFPRPLAERLLWTRKAEVDGKKIKRLRFISETVLRRILDGGPLLEDEAQQVWLQGGQVLADRADLGGLPFTPGAEGAALWALAKRPRVTVDRIDSSSTYFQAAEVRFAPGCGLWFGALIAPGAEDARRMLEHGLALLADSGLGGGRSGGLGQAMIAPTGPLELPGAEGRPWMCLSRYLPLKEECAALSDPAAAYALANAGGWLSWPGLKSERRRTIRVLVEGSCLGALSGEPQGQVVDVQPVYGAETRPVGAPVWRSGLAVGIGLPAAKGGQA